MVALLGCLALAPVAQAVGPATITLQLSPTSIVADGVSTATATATVTDLTGAGVSGETVAFASTDPGETISSTTDQGNGKYTATITSSTTPGTPTITATDTSAPSVPPAAAKLTQYTTTLTVLPSSTVSTNEPVSLVAAASGSQMGTITFYDGFSPISTCQGISVSPSSPVAVCGISFAASASPHSLRAVFTPQNGSTSGGSQPQTVNVIPASTTTSISVSPASARVAKKVTYTASVVAGNQGPVSPSGSVRFANRGRPIGSCSSVALQAIGGALTASCSVRYSTLGTRLVTANYSGDQNFSGSSSGVRQVQVQAQGVITATLQWNFFFTPSHSRLLSLVLNGASLGTKVIFTCQGQRCPFAKLTSTVSGGVRCTPTAKHPCVPHGKGPINLTGVFQGHRLMVGTRITIEIRRPGWIGKFYALVIRSGQGPQARISCLAPGVSTPGIGCTLL